MRNPEDRLYSYYNYYVSSQVEIPASISFEKFIVLCRGYYKGEISSENYQLKKGHYRALAAGRYINYLRQYLKIFDMAQIKVMFYEDFKKDNLFFINQICEFLDIDPYFYHKFEFKHSNITYSAQNEKFHHLLWNFYRKFFYNFLFHCPGFKENLVSIYKKFGIVNFV